MKLAIITAAICAITIGCKPAEIVVLRQSIPVSSNPSGAEVLVDGAVAGNAPMVLQLTRTENHIVTLKLPGYRQEDVVVKKVYQERSKFEAIQAGVSSGVFFESMGMGMGSAVNKVKEQDATGEAFLLEPSAIAVVMHKEQK